MASPRRLNANNEGPHGNRRGFIDLPLDVLSIEIFPCLEPMELLNLSRTAKWLRAFLLSRRESSALWKHTIDKVGLPPCPDWMSPPAYAFLAFDPVCHGCFDSCEIIDWNLRMRSCPNCYQKMTVSTHGGGANPRCFSLPCSKMLHIRFEGKDVWRIVEYHSYSGTINYSRSDLELVQTWERPLGVALADFVAQKNAFWRSIEEHANSCRAWERRQLQKKVDQLSLAGQRRYQRHKDIKAKVAETSSMLAPFCDLPDFRELPEVKKGEQLTSQEWTEIGPQLIYWLQDAFCDRRRRRSLHDSILSLTVARLRDTTSLIRPRDIDIATIPAVRSAIEDDIMSDRDMKPRLDPVLLNAFKNWCADAVDELKQMAWKGLDLPLRSKPSSLLPVIFRCKTCLQGLRFNNALRHEHLYKVRPKERSTSLLSPYERFLRCYPTYPRNTRALQVDVVASRRVGNLVRQFGRNPTKVTYEELSLSTRKVICNLCPPKVATGMTFTEAFEHCLHAHSEQDDTEMWAV